TRRVKRRRKRTGGPTLRWGSHAQALANVRTVLSQRCPELMASYARWGELSDAERELFRQRVYEVSVVQLKAWGLAAVFVQVQVPYFGGSRATLLQQVFPKARLNRLGFQWDWSTPTRAIASIRYALQRERPDLLHDYDRWDHLSAAEQQSLR